MKLELKESNSPFWLIGLNNGKITQGSFTNVPCYYKSSKKQYELAKKIIKEPTINEVYLITGIVWDNMKSSWSIKEAGSYVQNKGKLILSKDEITDYEEKHGSVEYNESKKNLKENSDDLYIFNSNIKNQSYYIANEIWDDIDTVMKKDGEKCKIIKSKTAPGFPYEFDEMIHDIQFKDGTVINNVFGKFLIPTDYEEKYEFINNKIKPELKIEDIDTLDPKLKNKFDNLLANGGQKDFEKLPKNEIKLFAKYVKSLEDVSDLIKGIILRGLSFAHGDDLTIESKDDKKSNNLKESKIVTPVGNPQIANSFVNIDVDLDHMEVSDFIVRLAQAIRSEQNAVLEYVALKSANGVTNEDVTVLDEILKEEKNHMAALVTLLYKQILMNHKENMDGANQEFILPKLGIETFDNSDDIKLNESINNIIDNVLKEKIYINNVSSTISQDQYSVSVDVNYDLDYIGKLGENLERAIKQLNKEFFIKDKYAISETSENGNVDWNLGDTFDFTLLTYNGFDKEVNEEFLRRVCEILFKKASTYECFIELA